MAASLRFISRALYKNQFININCLSFTYKRYLLSESYSCKEAWRKYLEDPVLSKASHTELAYQIKDQLEKTSQASSLDMNILAHHFHSMDEEEIEFMEDILSKFTYSQSSYPRNDSTSHAIAMGYLNAGYGDRLVNILTNWINYAYFPNHYTLNIILDHYLRQGNYRYAAKVAYHSMIQEDFSQPINTLLSLYATIHHLLSPNIEEPLPVAEEKSEEDKEETWVKVNYIKFPYYDDHFDIKNEKLLLGKTLIALADAPSITVPPLLQNALKVTGYGLYQKYSKGLVFLNSVLHSAGDSKVPEVALNFFNESLENVKARDPNEPEVELALRTIDDVIHRLLPTTDEKQKYLSEFAQVKENLQAKGKIVKDFDFKQPVVDLVTSNLSKYEESDIQAQLSLFGKWTADRQTELNKEIEEFKKNARIEEMKRQVKELQEQEEILSYFDLEEKLRLKFLDEDRATDKGLTISK